MLGLKRGNLALASILTLAVLFLVGVAIFGSTRQAKTDRGQLTGLAPWPSNSDGLFDRTRPLNLPDTGTSLHMHEHLDIFVHGVAIKVPAQIGIDESTQYATPLHTHDDSGVIHVESADQQDFTLGEFMIVWGLKFDSQHLGGYTASGANKLQVFVNGQPLEGDPRNLKLQPHQEILIAFGDSHELPKPMPATYHFPADL